MLALEDPQEAIQAAADGIMSRLNESRSDDAVAGAPNRFGQVARASGARLVAPIGEPLCDRQRGSGTLYDPTI